MEGPRERLTLVEMLPGLVAIAVWGVAGTALTGLLGWGWGPFDRATLEPHVAGLVVGLVVVGAVPALPRGGWLAFAALMAGAAVGLLFFVAERAYFAGVHQGGSVILARGAFTAFAFGVLVAGFTTVAVGHAAAVLLLAVLRPRPSRRVPGRAVPGVVVTLAACAVAAALMASWLGSTRAVLDEAATSEVIHRVTITSDRIDLDASTIPAGRVTWLVTVEGDVPHDLALVDEARRAIYGIGTPPAGSVDFLVARQDMTPGTWVFTAGMPEPDPHPTGFELPLGRLQATFEVTP